MSRFIKLPGYDGQDRYVDVTWTFAISPAPQPGHSLLYCGSADSDDAWQIALPPHELARRIDDHCGRRPS